MDLSRITIVPKVTTYEFDRKFYGLTHDELIAKYRRESVNPEKIIRDHESHAQSVLELKKFFDESQFVHRDRFTNEIAAAANLVIALGGDDHFQYVPHFIDDTLVMGVNSNPESSEGFLNYFTAMNFERFLARLEKDDYAVEKWTRLEATLNGIKHPPATGHYFFGESDSEDMSQYIVEFNGKSEKQKSSGIMAATGAGSTGWYKSAGRYLHLTPFPKTERIFKFCVREVHDGNLAAYSMLEGTLKEGEELRIHSLNRRSGRFSIDSTVKFPFPRGSEAIVRIYDSPLKVVKM